MAKVLVHEARHQVWRLPREREKPRVVHLLVCCLHLQRQLDLLCRVRRARNWIDAELPAFEL